MIKINLTKCRIVKNKRETQDMIYMVLMFIIAALVVFVAAGT